MCIQVSDDYVCYHVATCVSLCTCVCVCVCVCVCILVVRVEFNIAVECGDNLPINGCLLKKTLVSLAASVDLIEYMLCVQVNTAIM